MVSNEVVMTEEVYSLHKYNNNDLMMRGWQDKTFQNCCIKYSKTCSFLCLTYVISVSKNHYVTLQEKHRKSRNLGLIFLGKEECLLSYSILKGEKQSCS